MATSELSTKDFSHLGKAAATDARPADAVRTGCQGSNGPPLSVSDEPGPTSDTRIPLTPSLAALLVRYESWVRGFIARRVDPSVLERTSVDDLYQEVAAIALGSARSFQFRDDGRFLAWMAVIVVRCIWRMRRAINEEPRRIRLRVSDSTRSGFDLRGVPCSWPSPSSLVHRNERAIELHRQIQRLPARYRHVITAYGFERRSLRDIAKELGCTHGAAARVLDRALDRLQREMPAP